jgi:hypothetical protein
LSVREAAILTGWSQMTIRGWITSGKITRHQGATPGRGGHPPVLVNRAELIAYHRAKKPVPVPVPVPKRTASIPEAADVPASDLAGQLLDAMRREGIKALVLDADRGTCHIERVKIVKETWSLK